MFFAVLCRRAAAPLSDRLSTPLSWILAACVSERCVDDTRDARARRGARRVARGRSQAESSDAQNTHVAAPSTQPPRPRDSSLVRRHNRAAGLRAQRRAHVLPTRLVAWMWPRPWLQPGPQPRRRVRLSSRGRPAARPRRGQPVGSEQAVDSERAGAQNTHAAAPRSPRSTTKLSSVRRHVVAAAPGGGKGTDRPVPAAVAHADFYFSVACCLSARPSLHA